MDNKSNNELESVQKNGTYYIIPKPGKKDNNDTNPRQKLKN